VALDDSRHPDAEQLAEYADGVLGADVRAKVEEHLVNCPDCRAVLIETTALAAVGRDESQTIAAELGPGALSRRWVAGAAAGLAAAASLVLVVRLARPDLLDRVFGPRRDRPELQELIAAVANEPTRPVEGRLSGGFKYGPPPSPTRGPGDREVPPDVRMAAAKIEKLAEESDTPENQAALGRAYLALGDSDKAVQTLEAAARRAVRDARVESDLSAAYLARAKSLSRADDIPRALAAADRSIAIDPALVEPYFNRALALAELHLNAEAVRALDTFLSVDPVSPWTAEARLRAERLRSVSGMK
jgi:tetratricopeptide (TPR) repeat protein